METNKQRAIDSFNDDSRMPLKIRFDLGDREVKKFAQNFSILSDVYSKLYLWNLVVSQAEQDSIEGTHSRQSPRRMLSGYVAEIPAEHRLRLTELEITPVTYLAVTGAQKPLLTLEHYLAQRHVDWDREAKEPSEAG